MQNRAIIKNIVLSESAGQNLLYTKQVLFSFLLNSFVFSNPWETERNNKWILVVLPNVYLSSL